MISACRELGDELTRCLMHRSMHSMPSKAPKNYSSIIVNFDCMSLAFSMNGWDILGQMLNTINRPEDMHLAAFLWKWVMRKLLALQQMQKSTSTESINDSSYSSKLHLEILLFKGWVKPLILKEYRQCPGSWSFDIKAWRFGRFLHISQLMCGK